MNHLRAALFAAPAYVSVVSVLLLWPPSRSDPARARALTLAALLGAPLAAAAAGAASWARDKWGPRRVLWAFRWARGGARACGLRGRARGARAS